MYTGRLIFSQIMDHLPMHEFRRCVHRYQGNHRVKSFRCHDQYLSMAFAQLTFRESLRSTESCLQAQHTKLYHMGIRGGISRSTLADANEQRDWRIYADFSQTLIQIARPLYAGDDLGLDLDNTIYALDATTIDLCLSAFPWAHFRSTKAAVKLHTLLDLRGNIPTFIHISDGKLHDVHALDFMTLEAGAFYIMDRGYVDFTRLYKMHLTGAFFVTRDKSNLKYQRRYSHEVDKSTGLRCDQTIFLTGVDTPDYYPQALRRIKYYDAKTEKTFNFLTNNFVIPAITVADLYRNPPGELLLLRNSPSRWQVELFFKWIKQHLRIKSFFGTSENAVKTQVWIAISVYVLVAIIKKRLNLEASLYNILQILSATIFERMSLNQLLADSEYKTKKCKEANQLILFD